MLGSYTSGPNGAFLAYLRDGAPERDRVDWMAVDRSIAAGRDHYHELWETGALSGGELADAIAIFHNLPRVRAERCGDELDRSPRDFAFGHGFPHNAAREWSTACGISPTGPTSIRRPSRSGVATTA